MKERLILTLSLGKERKYINITRQFMELYAINTNSDFIVVDDNDPFIKENKTTYKNGRNNNISYILKVKLIYYYLGLYKRVLWLDDTCVIKKNTENLFEMMPDTNVAAYNEGSMNELYSWKYDKQFIKNVTNYLIDEKKYINTGVVLYSQSIREHLSDEYIEKYKKLFESKYPHQCFVNFIIQSNNIQMTFLKDIYNKILINGDLKNEWRYTGEEIDSQKIIDSNNQIYHITGYFVNRYDIVKKLCDIVLSTYLTQ